LFSFALVANADTVENSSFRGQGDASLATSNKFFKEKQYEKSAQILLDLLEQKVVNSSIYYNLGNCYYEMKEFPKAILYYEKANKLDRNNEAIQHNLNLAYNKALTKIETSQQFFLFQWGNNFMYQYNLKTWSIFCVIALWCFAIAGFLYFRKPDAGYGKWVLVSFAAALLLFFISLKNFNYQHRITHAIIMQPADVFTHPSELKKTKNTLEAGNKVKLLDEDGNFYKVKTGNDKIVWLLKSEVEGF
jgi:tetratricopeptide (TPR) repeat protein